jgi:hypothetical protein
MRDEVSLPGGRQLGGASTDAVVVDDDECDGQLIPVGVWGEAVNVWRIRGWGDLDGVC